MSSETGPSIKPLYGSVVSETELGTAGTLLNMLGPKFADEAEILTLCDGFVNVSTSAVARKAVAMVPSVRTMLEHRGIPP